MRKTVKIRMPGDATERDFHLDETKAEQFAERIRRDGGEVSVIPFTMSPVLASMLKQCGLSADSIH